jgi:hypothetical protein
MFTLKREEALIESITHVLNLVDEELTPDILTPVTEYQQLSYKNLEFLAISLYYQLTFLEKKHQLTFYTLNIDYLFSVKREGIIKAFVYGYNFDDKLIDTISVFKIDTGIATRYCPLEDDMKWKEHIDPTLILYSGLPIRFHYKTIYYSVASLLEKLFGRDLVLISGTKLDGFIKRARNRQIPQRVLAL